MVFSSALPEPQAPHSDVFTYVFHEGRNNYPSSQVVYRVHETQETLALAQLEEYSRRFASVLHDDYNAKTGDVVTIFALNSIRYPVAFFGCLAAGASASPIAYQKDLDTKAVAARVQSIEAMLLNTDITLYPIAREVAALSGNMQVISLDQVPGLPSFDKMLAAGDSSFNQFHLNSTGASQDHTVMIFRTSGSAGAINNSDTWVATPPFAYGITAKLYMGLNILLGIPVVIPLQPFDQASLPLVDEYNITFLFMTPPLAAEIAKSEVRGSFRSIKWLLSAGAPVHAKIRDAVQDKFHGTRLALEWGTTETLLIALQLDGVAYPPGSSGSLVNGMEARVVDLETGRELGPCQRGELLVRNRLCRFAGYLGAAANAGFDADGWYHSGDGGYVDGEGHVFIVDRVKQSLRVGDGCGTHLARGELEAALFDHPAVGTTVVVGVRDEATQVEHPTAFVVLAAAYVGDRTEAGLRGLAAELEAFVEAKVGTFKRLSGGVYFVLKYPHTGFKVNRRALAGLVDSKTPVSERPQVISMMA